MLKHQLSAVGRLAADPEARYTPQGTAVANARVAIEDGYWSTDEGKWISRTIWATLTFWGNAAEAVAERAHKGDQIDFRASLVYDPETGGPKMFDGKKGKGTKFEFRVTEFQVFPKVGNSGAGKQDDPETDVPVGEEDEIPF